MKTTDGALHFEALLTKEQFDRSIRSLENQIRGISRTTERETNQMDRSFRKLSLGLGTYFSAKALRQFTMALINVRGEFQQTEIAFRTMLKSDAKAKALMSDMLDLAARTPFSLREVSEGAKQLLAFQVPAEEVTDTLKRMGDIASGLSVPLGRIQLVFGQVRAKGKLMGDDLRQFTEAGVPMIAELSKHFGKAESEISKMVSEGKVGFEDVKSVLFKMTDAGGMFYNLMEKQSESLTGKMSNLRDAVDQMFNEIGESSEGILSSGIDAVALLVEHYKAVGSAILTLASAVGVYKAAIIATKIQKDIAYAVGLRNIVLWRRLTLSKKAASIAVGVYNGAIQTLNATMLKNPAFWVVAGLGALTYGIYKFARAETQAERATRLQNEALEERIKVVNDTRNRLTELNSIINDDSTTEHQKDTAFHELKMLLPQLIGDMSRYEYQAKLTAEGQSLVNKAMEDFKVAKMREEIDELTESIEGGKRELDKINEAIKWGSKTAGIRAMAVVRTVEENEKLLAQKQQELRAEEEAIRIANLGREGQLEHYEKERRKWQDVADSYKRELDNVKNKFGDVTLGIREGLTDIFAEVTMQTALKKVQGFTDIIEGLKPKTEVKNKAHWAKQQAEALAEMEKFDNKDVKARTDEFIKQEKLYNEATEKLEIYMFGRKGKKTTPRKRAEEILPKGSLAEIQERLSKLNRVIEKTPIKSPKIEGLKAQRVQLEKELTEARKTVQIKSQEDSINEMLSKWRLYYKSVELYGKESTDKNPFFKSMSDSSMVSYIEEQITELTKLKDPTIEQVNLLIDLKTQLNEIKGIEDPMEAFRNSITELKEESESTLDYINKLKKLRLSIADDDSPESYNKTREIDGAIEQSQKELEQTLLDLLEEGKTFNERIKDINSKYDELIAQAVNKSFTDEGFDLEGAKEKIGEWKKEQLNEVEVDQLEASQSWKIVFSDIENHSRKAVRVAIKELRKLAMTAKLSPEAFLSIMKQIEDVENELDTEIDKLIKKLKKAFDGDFNLEAFGDALGSISGIIDGVGNDVVSIFEDITGESGDMARQVIGDITNIATGLGEIAEGVASGNPVAIISGLAKVVHTVSAWISGDRKRQRAIERHKKAVEVLQATYRRLQQAISNAFGEEVYANQTKLIANLQKQKEHVQGMLDEEKGKKKKDDKAIQEYENSLANIDQQITDIKNNMIESLTQTTAQSLSNELAEALEGAYKRGEDAAIAWGKVADDVIKRAVRNALRVKLLEAPIRKLIEELYEDMGGDDGFTGLSQEDIDKFKNGMKGISEQFNEAMAQFPELFGSDFGDNSMTGAIKGVSEQTAGLIEGQMNAIRINQGEMLALAQSQHLLSTETVNQLSQIQVNTSYLVSLHNDLSDLRNYFLVK